MNRDLQEYPIVRSRAYAAIWASAVVRAADVINHYSKFAAACVDSFVRCVIPLVGSDEVIGSASREDALGMIYLPAVTRLDQLTECLLHETMHQYLYRIEECGDLFSSDTDSRDAYYSPWRTDARPLRMTLHGAFVFAAVAHLYLWNEAHSALELDAGECARRAYYRAKQVRLALDVVRRHAKLTKFGMAVIEAVNEDSLAIMEKVRPATKDRVSADELIGAHFGHHIAYAH
jgi:HEXXH motif-containing protein